MRGRQRSEDEKLKARDLAYKVINKAIEGLPNDLILTTHICRGNYKSTWAISEDMKPSPLTYLKKI